MGCRKPRPVSHLSVEAISHKISIKKKKTKKEKAKDLVEESIRLEQGLGLYEVPIAGLKKGGMVDRNYLKGK